MKQFIKLILSQGAENAKPQVDEWIKQKTNGKMHSIIPNSRMMNDQHPHMDGYAASLFTPIQLSAFHNTNTEKVLYIKEQ